MYALLHCICNYSLHFALHQTFSAAVYFCCKRNNITMQGVVSTTLVSFVIMLLVLYMNVSALAAAESRVFHMR